MERASACNAAQRSMLADGVGSARRSGCDLDGHAIKIALVHFAGLVVTWMDMYAGQRKNQWW